MKGVPEAKVSSIGIQDILDKQEYQTTLVIPERKGETSTFIVEYEHRLERNGDPRHPQKHERLFIGYGHCQGTFLFKEQWQRYKLQAVPIEIVDGIITKPEDKAQAKSNVHVAELDDRVVEALRKITHQDVQAALGKYIRGY